MKNKKISLSYLLSDKSPLIPWLFLAPFAFFFIVFMVYPMIQGLYVSFTNFTLLSERMDFVGLRNYQNFFRAGDLFLISLRNTFEYVALAVPILISIGLLTAVIVNSPIKGRMIFRGALSAPFVINVASVALIWTWLLDREIGLINYYFQKVGLPRQEWIYHPFSAMMVIVMVSLWGSLGSVMLPLLAGLQDIPQELYEAALIDGGNKWHLFRYITIPLLKPIILFVGVSQVVAGFQVFGQVTMITGGGPGNSTRVVLQHLYEVGFNWFRLGEAAAMSWILFLIIMVFTIIQFKYLSGRAEY
ncbi:MAG: carbohydrate ABC transporter permease [bacterium]